MKKRVTAAGCAALLGISALAGIVSVQADETKTVDLPLTDEDVTLTVWMQASSTTAQNLVTYAETPVAQEAMKRTGVTIEYTHPASSATQEQFNLLIASGNLPDIMWYNKSNAKYSAGLDALIDDGIFLDLTDYLEYMPNYVAVMNRNEETLRECKTDTGRYPIAWMINSEKEASWGGPMIRKDWLDELGLEIPVTYDDWHEVLTQFKEKKNASAPLLVDSTSFFTGSRGLNAGYDCLNGFIDRDGTVVYSPTTDEYKEFLLLMRDWYEEGLIDPEFTTSDSDVLIATDQAGAKQMGVWVIPGMYESLYDQEWVAVPYPVKKEGEKGHLGMPQTEVCEDGMGITTSCKDPVLAAKWIDYWYSEEGSLLRNYGIEGETFTYIDGKPQLTDEIREAKADGSKADDDWMGVSMCGIYDWTRSLYGNSEKNLVCYDIWTDSVERDYNMPAVTLTTDEGSRYAAIMGDVNTYVEESIVNFVTGATDIESEWEKYLDQLKAMGIEEATKIQQDALERYENR